MRIQKWNLLLIFRTGALLGAMLILMSCASSDVSRNSATEVDNVYGSASKIGSGSDPLGAYQNASQKVKGGIIGGAAGAVVGSVSSAVGTVPGAIGGAVFGAAIGAYIDSHTNWQDKLDNAGGKVIILGDQVKVILPSNNLFHSMSAQINNSAYSTLDLVADFLCSLDKISVKVAAYSNATGSALVNQEITQEQADAVARYLWAKGVNARLITAIGYDGSHLMTKNSYDWNNGDNYRIEITVEKV